MPVVAVIFSEEDGKTIEMNGFCGVINFKKNNER